MSNGAENTALYTLGIDIGSTTVKIAVLDGDHNILFSDYRRHFANIRETLKDLIGDAYKKLGNLTVHPMITGIRTVESDGRSDGPILIICI